MKTQKIIKQEFERDFEGLVNDTCSKYQELYDINSGDIRPEDAFRIDEIRDELLSLILHVIEYEMD